MKNSRSHNEKKLKEMIKLLLLMDTHEKGLSLIRLNKMLFSADFIAFIELGVTVSGVSYHKDTSGPVPDCVLKILNELKQDEDGNENHTISPNSHPIRFSKRILNNVDTSLFTHREMVILDSIIERFNSQKYVENENFSSELLGWHINGQGKYFSASPISNPNQPIPDSKKIPSECLYWG